MKPAALESLEPTGLTPRFSPFDLARLDLSPPASSDSDHALILEVERVDWDQVHRQVQRVFTRLAARIQHRWPMIRTKTGKSSARSYFLFSFMTFDLGDQEELDPVIVGLTFEPSLSGDGVRVRGDISGEETGRIDFELPEIAATDTRGGVLPIALEMATILAEQADLIARSVFDRYPPPAY